MRGLSSVQTSGTKDSQLKSGLSSNKARKLKDTNFQEQLTQANTLGVFPNAANIAPAEIPNFSESTRSESSSESSEESNKEAVIHPRTKSFEKSKLEYSKASDLAEMANEDFEPLLKELNGQGPKNPNKGLEQSAFAGAEIKANTGKSAEIGNPANADVLAKLGRANLEKSKEKNLEKSGPGRPGQVGPSFDELPQTRDSGGLPLLQQAGAERFFPLPRLNAPELGDSRVSVSYAPFDRADLAAEAEFRSADKLWLPLPTLDDSASEALRDLRGEEGNADPGIQKFQTHGMAERILKTSLSGNDFVNMLNSTKLLPGEPKNSPGQWVVEKNAIPTETLLPREFKAAGALENSRTSGKNSFEELKKVVIPLGGHAGVNIGSDKSGSAPLQLSGNVTSGAMAKERLSSESLTTLSTNIRGLSGQGGGEIRMRLKPENMGELTIRVSTLGSRVELNIQASDERTKKIIEESIGYLKDSLSSQNLSLANVDFSVASHSSANSDPGSDPRSAQSQTDFQDALGQQGRRGESSGNWGRGGSEGAFSREAGVLARPLTSEKPDLMGRPYANSNFEKRGRIDVRG